MEMKISGLCRTKKRVYPFFAATSPIKRATFFLMLVVLYVANKNRNLLILSNTYQWAHNAALIFCFMFTIQPPSPHFIISGILQGERVAYWVSKR